jgi:hypothetical protein
MALLLDRSSSAPTCSATVAIDEQEACAPAVLLVDEAVE